MALTRKQLLQNIEKSYRKYTKTRRSRILSVLSILAGIFLIYLVFIFRDVPNPTKLTKTPAPISTQLLDRNGKLLYEVYSEYKRTPISLADVPLYVQQATIAIEDKNFYHHHGIDVTGIIRAAFNTLTKGKRLAGGSTLTQQLVKNSLLNDNNRTLTRKIKEAILAIATEFTYSKSQILELYLNYTPYGGTAYGIQSAAQTYFGKNAKDLDLAESALLAGLPQSPTTYSPFGAHPESAITRQHQVLTQMVDDKYITQDQADEARAEKLVFAKNNITINAPHFALMVRDALVQKYGEDKVNLGGLRVTTTLDLDLQQTFEASLSAEMKKIAKLKISNGAAVVTKPNTGEILALIGSKDYFSATIDGQVNVTTALRQPGSSIKPINYATALLKGWPTSMVYLDIPTCFNVVGQKEYCPKNYDNTFRGPVSMRQSLANSLNIPAVKQLAMNGLDSFIATASAMGISTWTDPSQYGLSLTLGGGEVTMLDMAKAFGTFANSGVTVPLISVLKVEDYTGEVLEQVDTTQIANAVSVMPENWTDFWQNQNQPQTYQATDPRVTLPQEVTFIISDILADNGARSAAFGTSSQLVIPGHTVSVKTGTTNDLKDNWAIGYTPDYLVATWVGNNDNSSMSYVASGVTGASPIWNDIMRRLLKGVKDRPLVKPEQITNFQVCNLTGLLAQQENQCESHSEYFITNGNLPLGQSLIPLRQQIWVRRSDKYPVLPGDETVDRDLEEHTVISDPFTQNFCLDCAYPVDDKGKITYPQTVVDYTSFQAKYVTPSNYINYVPASAATP
jgi:1A family penicillin-binding protein